jgi:RimJ/RimL family protein N-acetyltransferase
MNITKDILTIRNATAKDAQQLAAWWNDGTVMAHAGFPHGLGTTAEKVAADLEGDSDETTRRHIIELSGKPIGEMNYRSLGEKTAIIGIKICDFAEQNKGYGTVLLTVFIDALFRHMDYETIDIDTNLTNTRAQKVYEQKLGFRKICVNENSWINQLGELQSQVCYKLSKEDWLTAHPKAEYSFSRNELPSQVSGK